MRALSVLLGVTLLSVSAFADAPSLGTQPMSATCDVTESVTDRPPDDPGASSFASPGGTWYANANRTLWAWWWGRRSVGDYKVLWVRPRGAWIKVAGRRMNGESRPFSVDLSGTDRATFRTSAIAFPTAGCWQVTATAGSEVLEFIVDIP